MVGVLGLMLSCAKRKVPWDTSMTPARKVCVRELKQLMKDTEAASKVLPKQGDSLAEPARRLEALRDRVDNLLKAGLIDDYLHEDLMEPLENCARGLGLELRKAPRTGQPKLGPPPSEVRMDSLAIWELTLFHARVLPLHQIAEGKAGGSVAWRDGKLRSPAWRVQMGLRSRGENDSGWEPALAAKTETAPAPATAAKPDAAKADAARRAIEFLQGRAAAGSPSAAYDLAVRYLNGDGVNKDLEAARKWLRLAADKGNTQAAAKLQELDKAK